ncbi:MAG: YggT family protein [Gemmatimonadota bacterium]
MNPGIVAAYIDLGVRLFVAGAFALSAVVALTHWAVRSGKLQPFSGWPRFVRGWSDPLLKPVEKRLVRAGGNPQSAPLWLVGLTVLGGLALISLVRWLIGFIFGLLALASNPAGLLLPTIVHYTFSLLIGALMVRVIGSWFGLGPHNRFMRIFYILTDWLVEPLQRVLPNVGMFDISPLVAYLVLSLARTLVLNAFWG